MDVAVETGLGEWLPLSCLATHKYLAQSEAWGMGPTSPLVDLNINTDVSTCPETHDGHHNIHYVQAESSSVLSSEHK